MRQSANTLSDGTNQKVPQTCAAVRRYHDKISLNGLSERGDFAARVAKGDRDLESLVFAFSKSFTNRLLGSPSHRIVVHDFPAQTHFSGTEHR